MILVLILIVGSLLRFYGLDIQSLWNDELSRWSRSGYENLTSVISNLLRDDIHPPGHHILFYFVEKYIGDSESILRLPSAVAGILSILAIFLLGLQLYTYKEALIVSALMAVLWCPIYYSQEAAPYSMLILFSMLTTYFWILILKNLNGGKKSTYAIFGYVVSAIIISYLHYVGLAFVALQYLGAVLLSLRRRKTLVYISLVYFLILLAYLPWLPNMYKQVLNNREAISYLRPPENLVKAFLNYFYFLFNNSKVIGIFILILYLSFFLRGLRNTLNFATYRHIRTTLLSPGSLLVCWFIIPFAGTYVTSILLIPILNFRYLIISMPAAYLLLARSITQLPLRSRYKTVLATAIVGLLLFHLIFSMNYYTKPTKEQFREAVKFIVGHDNLYKDSLIIGYAWNPNYLNYYFTKISSDRRVEEMGGEEKDILNVDKLITKKNPKYIWYITAHRVPEAKFLIFLNKRLTFIEHKEFISADVWLFRNKQIE